MSAQYVSSTLIRNITGNTGKTIAITYVNRTTAWVRPAEFPNESVRQEFAKVAEENAGAFKSNVVKIAMKESEHQSDMDKRVHYTAYGLNDKEEVVDVQHLTREIKICSNGFSSMIQDVKGQSGRLYTIERVLQDKGGLQGCVYLAKDGTTPVILKDIPQDYDARARIYHLAGRCSHLRCLLDTIPERKMFVFEYLNQNLFHLAREGLPMPIAKFILKSALEGLAALHQSEIVHNDVKANNIMVHTASHASRLRIEKVQLVDLEDAAHVPPGSAVVGAQVGNVMWRSPEAHAMGPIRKPSDMFSFGIVCIFAVTQILPFAVDDSELPEGVEMLAVILERHISYFADEGGFNGLLQYLGNDNKWVEVFEVIKAGFGEKQPRKPFALWRGLNLDQEDLFKDLVMGLTNFDPEKRLTAQQALEHDWFKGVSDVF